MTKTRTFEWGKNSKEIREAKAKVPLSDILFRKKHNRKYFCAKCAEPMTAFDHIKYIFMCGVCAQNGQAHYSQYGNKLKLTNRGH